MSWKVRIPALSLTAAFAAILLFGSSRPAGPRTFDGSPEALDYAVTRILAVEPEIPAGDAYASTFPRKWRGLDGRESLHALVRDAAGELALAEAFLVHGFGREALCHLDHVLRYHPTSFEARVAEKAVELARRHTVFSLVAPLAMIVEDDAGRRFLPALGEEAAPPAFDRPQSPYLQPGLPGGSLKVVGYVDAAGRIVQQAAGADGSFAALGPSLLKARFYRLSPAARTLQEAEDLAKAALFDTEVTRRAARALAYAGRTARALEILAQLGEAAPSIRKTDLDDPRSALHLDARWRRAVEEAPGLRLVTASAVTTGASLPLKLDLRAIPEIRFTFVRLEGPFPALEKDLKAWLAAARATPSHALTLAVPPGASTLDLPIREPGVWRVAAEARGLRGEFLAIRTDASIDILAVPGEILLRAGRPGVSFTSGEIHLGTTGPEGTLTPRRALPVARYCPEHVQCCSGCVSCAHHHGSSELQAGSSLFVSDGRSFFRASSALDTSEIDRLVVTAPAPVLLVHTDRPVYKAGDTMRFRGILRTPRTPLPLDAPSRLVAAPEREVALSVRAGNSVIFQRTYVTGEFGTFDGEFAIPLSTSRGVHALRVAFEGAEMEQAFEVQDYRRSDFSVVLSSTPEGVRVQAGYVWGAPVPGTLLRCTVNGKEVDPVDGLLKAADGDRVKVVLLRGEEELVRKSAVHRVSMPAAAPPPAAETAPAPAAVEAAPAPAAPLLKVSPTKPAYGPGETIEVEIEGPEGAEVLVVAADTRIYGTASLTLRKGRGLARFPLRAIYDPGLTVFAVSGGLRARTEIRVRTQEMAVEVKAPAAARPGERVEVEVRGAPGAAFALSAVDEAIYALREDDTPLLYAHFHPSRPAALAVGRLEKFEWDGEKLLLETPPEAPELLDPGSLAGSTGGRFGGRRNLVAMGGGGGQTEDSVLASLRGPSRLQNPDGSWSSAFHSEAGPIGDVGGSSLMLLSYLGAGYSHLSKDTYGGISFGDVVRKSLQWLLGRQDAAGSMHAGSLEHALATLAVSEAYGLTGSNLFKEPAEKAIASLARRQADDGGWGGILPSVFAVMALKSGQLGGLAVPPATSTRAFQYFDREVDEDGLCGNPPTRATVGGAAAALIFLRGERGDPRLSLAAGWLLENAPDWIQADFLGWYLGSLALFQFDGPSGAAWKRWNEFLKPTLVKNQPKDGLWTLRGERVVPTALGALSLECYYRYANVFGAAGAKGAGHPPLAPPARIRLLFPDTALWIPELRTDAQGSARASFVLPDAITSTRLTARGVTREGPVGEAVGRVSTRLPFFVKIRAPEVVVLGDEVEVRVDVFNATKEALKSRVALGVEEQALAVPAEGSATAWWRVKAEDPRGLVLKAVARAPGHEDAAERSVPVRRPDRETFVTRRGRAAGGLFKFDAPAGTQEAVVQVHPRNGSFTQLLEALRYLNAYPHGCTEQTLSRFVPNVLTAEALRELGIPVNAFHESFADMMRVGVERVLHHQTASGGWGWYGPGVEDTFMTATALRGLSECVRLGTPVDAVALKRGRARLVEIAAAETDLNRLAYASSVLLGEFDRLLAARAKLSPYAQAHLVLGLAKAGRPEAAELARELAAAVRVDHWETRDWHQRWDDVSVDTTAWAIQALAAVDPRHPLIPKAARWLIEQRKGGRWRSTRDTATAILALLRAAGRETAEDSVGAGGARRFGMSLDGRGRMEILLDPANPLASRFTARFEGLDTGAHAVKLEGEAGEVDVEVALRVLEGSPAAEAKGLGLRVETDRALDALKVGDEVRVTLHLRADDDADYVMVRSPLPAGCSVLRGSGEGDLERFEERYDEALFFLNALPKGERILSYRMRCDFAGRYAVRPASALLMYNEEIRASTAPAAAAISP